MDTTDFEDEPNLFARRFRRLLKAANQRSPVLTLQNILTVIQNWSGIAALPLAALALRLNFLRYRASISDKLPDIRLHQLKSVDSKHGPYFTVSYEVKNRSDKNLHILAIVIGNAGLVRYSDGDERNAYGEASKPEGFNSTTDRVACQTHLRPSGSQRGESGFGGDSTYGKLDFQTEKKHGKLKICFEYAFSSEDEKKYRKTFVRDFPAKFLG